MTNFQKIKSDFAKMTVEDMVEEIRRKGEACDNCVYDSYTCSGIDCDWGIEKFLRKCIDSKQRKQ